MPKQKRQSIVIFRHRRLHSPRSIRLLSLHPSSDVSALLSVSLLEASLDDFPSDKYGYEALSYVWGSPTGSVPCTCDGKQLLITPNCNDALQHLRLPNQRRIIWVDAICIDQETSEESLKERNTQITLMGEVYRNAEITLCWLGSGNEYTAGLFERIRRIGNCPSKREMRKLLEYDEQLRQKGKLETGSTCLNHLFCHPWHSRIWTLQEVSFSRNCQIICGKQMISWDCYAAAARFLIFEEFIDELDAQAWKNYLSIQIRQDIRNSLLCMPSERGDDESITLLTSGLSQVRHLRATNPKDKIYGLYAVFSALGMSLPIPNYDKPLGKIYEEACLAIIFQSRSLQMLEYAASNARVQNLPSWVADWQDEDVTLVNPPTHATDGSQISKIVLSTLCPASGQLRVRGRVIGPITSRAESDFATLKFPSGSLPILKEDTYSLVGGEIDSLRLLVHRLRLFREWMRFLDEVPSPRLDEDSSDCFHELVTFNSQASFNSTSSGAGLYNVWIDILQYPNTLFDLSNGENLVETWKSGDKATLHHWTTELSQCSIVAAALVTKSARRDGHVPPEIAELLDFTAHISGNMGNRALILIHDNLIDTMRPGTAFHTATVNDSVVILEGSDHPVVLRRNRDKWSFVGPVFVLGIMDGEAWFDQDGAIKGLQDFVLI